MSWMVDGGLDQLCFGVQQNGIGVWPGPQDPITIVEVIGERLCDLVGAVAAVVVLTSFLCCLGGSPVLFMRRVSFPLAHVWFSGPDAVVLLDLQGNQGRRKARVLQDTARNQTFLVEHNHFHKARLIYLSFQTEVI